MCMLKFMCSSWFGLRKMFYWLFCFFPFPFRFTFMCAQWFEPNAIFVLAVVSVAVCLHAFLTNV
jgi:hypothetical protein